MPRKIDPVPRALTRNNRTTRLIFDLDASGTVVQVSADRVQEETDANDVVVGSVPVGGVSLPASAFPAGLVQRLGVLDGLIDTEEGQRGPPPPE